MRRSDPSNGSEDVAAALVLRTRWRSGELSTQRLELASFLGSDAARTALGKERPERFVTIARSGFATVRDQEERGTILRGRTFGDLARGWNRIGVARGRMLDGDFAAFLRTLGSDEVIGRALIALVRARLGAIDVTLRNSAAQAVGVAEAWLEVPGSPRPFEEPKAERRDLDVPKPMAALLAFVRFFALARRGDEAPWGTDETARHAAEVLIGLVDGRLSQFVEIVREPLIRFALRAPLPAKS